MEVSWLLRRLLLPETAGLELDDPLLSSKRRKIIENKGLLRRIYAEWYDFFAQSVPEGPGKLLEIGSGGGFLKKVIPGVVTSELFVCTGVDIVLDACKPWPFDQGALKSVFLLDVLHHLPDVRGFLREAKLAVRQGGIIGMVEPWLSNWSRLIYSRFHHEPFLPQLHDWSFRSTGPLSGANSALPWMIFERDKRKFEVEFPFWAIEKISPLMPFSYLVSGGVSMRSLCPQGSFSILRCIEKWSGLERRAAMFARIVLRRI